MINGRARSWDRTIFGNVIGGEYGPIDFAGKTVVDVGAHIGSFSILAAANGARRILAYEAGAENFGLLVQNCAALPAVECHHAAVWRSDTVERVLPLPDEASVRADVPFKWVLLNWNPHGHIPPGVYDTPHFDVHFYLDSIESTFAIQSGPCGPEHVRCDQFAEARQPVPEGYMHPDFRDVEAVAPAMGNHLIDPSAPEFHGRSFDRTWIYGVYGGRVTFYEEMVTVRYLESRPDACQPIKAPPRVARTGYYPTRSCIRYDASRAGYTVSLEGFALRQGSG